MGIYLDPMRAPDHEMSPYRVRYLGMHHHNSLLRIAVGYEIVGGPGNGGGL